MSKQTLFLFSLTVAFPAIAGLVRLRKIERSYYPFLIYLFVSVFNELLVRFAVPVSSRAARTIDWHLFNLFESIILILQFYYWKVFDHFKKLFVAGFVLLIVVWIVENLVVSTILKFNPVYLIGYSFTIVLLSVQTINHIIVHQNQTSSLSRNAMFIICVGLVIFFIYNIFVFTLQAKGISKTNKVLMTKVFEIRVYINAFSNILYGIAICLIPQKISRKNFFTEP
ncbi:MAG: hypothetical protein H7Y31_13060 [Chitinophagaceae bacterium]|nr:hypothetical protein [Chitinophagaceae bacterium]